MAIHSVFDSAILALVPGVDILNCLPVADNCAEQSADPSVYEQTVSGHVYSVLRVVYNPVYTMAVYCEKSDSSRRGSDRSDLRYLRWSLPAGADPECRRR